MTVELHGSDFDLSKIIRAGDSIFVSQGTAEPLTLTEALVRQRATVGPVSVFLGPAFSETWQAEQADFIRFKSYGALGSNGRLSKAGVLDVFPGHVSQLPRLLDTGELRCDVVFMQLSEANAAGQRSFGLTHDYLIHAARRARVVIAEVNDQVPWTFGGAEELASLRIDYLVDTSRPLLELKPVVIGEVERRIGQHAAQFIHDGAVLETGIGAIPDAILSALKDRRDLGIHTGLMGDSLVALVEAGVITNARKAIDRGKCTTGVLFGTPRLYAFVHNNPQVHLMPVTHTHNVAVMGQLDNFIAINSAIEVDLTGQVNAEFAGSDYIGAVGGQVDFVRGAWQSRGGRSIIALPATAKHNSISRVVARFNAGVTTTPRSDADLIVTEWGAAQLRGQTLSERVKRMIKIAHPDFQESLEREAFALVRSLR